MALQRRKALRPECFSCEVEHLCAEKRGNRNGGKRRDGGGSDFPDVDTLYTFRFSALPLVPFNMLLDLVKQLLTKLQYFSCTQYIACVILYFIYKNHHSPNAFVLAPRVVLVAKSQ
jgi:hypothetical protein